MKKKLPQISTRILQILKSHRGGIDIVGIRKNLGADIGVQQHLDRRLRDLYPLYVINKVRCGNKTLYVFKGVRKPGKWAFDAITKNVRAKVIFKADGRCQMCGATVQRDKIQLHIDHKLPQSWGGKSNEDNLWAICSTCNEGKKNYFATFDSTLMRAVLTHHSVHRRIAELLHMKQGKWVPCDLIEFVAHSVTNQTDWRKRLRELRYLGLKIKSRTVKSGKKRISEYKLENWVQIPENPSGKTREFERKRALANHKKKEAKS